MTEGGEGARWFALRRLVSLTPLVRMLIEREDVYVSNRDLAGTHALQALSSSR